MTPLHGVHISAGLAFLKHVSHDTAFCTRVTGRKRLILEVFISCKIMVIKHAVLLNVATGFHFLFYSARLFVC